MNGEGRRKRVSERNRNRTNDQYTGYIQVNIHIYIKRMFDIYTYIIATEWPLYIYACCIYMHVSTCYANKYRCTYTLLQIYVV